MKNLLLFIVITLTLASCIKEIPFNGDITDTKLVVNSIFNTDSVWKIHVSRSLSIAASDGDLTYKNNPVVKVLDASGNTIETLTEDNNNYYVSTMGNKPVIGNAYRVEVSSGGFETIYAETSVPLPVAITSVDTATVNDPNFGGEQLEIAIKFTDPFGQQNFYAIQVETQDYAINQNDTIWYAPRFEYIYSDDFILDEGGNEMLTFSDEVINGEEKVIRVNMFQNNGINGYTKVYLHALSKDAYDYYKSYNLYTFSNGDPFSQPVQIYTNVENGYGIFAGRVASVYAF